MPLTRRVKTEAMPSANRSGAQYPFVSRDVGPSRNTQIASTSSTATSSSPAINDDYDHSLETNENGKRNRYQYSCVQCQRRKQRCSRTFPCEKCVQRGIAHLCVPPSNLHRPSRRIRMRQKLALAASGKAQPDDKHEPEDDMDDMNAYELDDEQDMSSSNPSQAVNGSTTSGSGVLTTNRSLGESGPTDFPASLFGPHRREYDQTYRADPQDQDTRSQIYTYDQQHHQHQQWLRGQQSTPSDRFSTSFPQSHRSLHSSRHMNADADAEQSLNEMAMSRIRAAGRSSLSSSTRMPPPSQSPSYFGSSSAHEPDGIYVSGASRVLVPLRTDTRHSNRGTAPSGADALAQLATVAHWPALQQQTQRPNTSPDHRSRSTSENEPGAPSFSSSDAPIAAYALVAPSSSRSFQSAPTLSADQRSIVDADDAFIGKPALNGLGWNPFRRHDGVGTDLLSWTGQLGRGFGLVIPKYELRSVQQSLPSKTEAHRLLQIFLDDFNWSRFPSNPDELVKSVDICIDRCAVSDDVQLLPLMAFCLSIFGLATLDLAVRPYPTRPSRTYFFAARKALSLSESLGLHTLDSLRASLNLCRYLDLCRVPRSTWLQVASCMRGAIDLGLHLDGASLGQNNSATLQRRVLWSHIIQQDREWSVLFGRPMSEIPFSTTPTPTLQDYLETGLELPCAQYLVTRDAFRIYIERISRLFQEIAANSNTSPTTRIYDRALEIDHDVERFVESLPPCLSAGLSLSGGAMKHQDFSTTFYHHLCTNQILFFRSLLHRPFWMESVDLVSADKFKHSRQICVQLALSDLRGRRLLSRRIPVTMLCHLYGSAYSLLSMNTIIASDVLFALEFDETLNAEEVQEKLGFMQEYVATVRANIQESRGDHLAVKELYLMRSLLKRIQDKVATLNPQSVGFQILGVRCPGGCADRLAMTLTELQSAASLLLNMARAGVRIDDATRIPPTGEDKTATSSHSNPSSAPSPSSGGVLAVTAARSQPHGGITAADDAHDYGNIEAQNGMGRMAATDSASASSMWNANHANGVTPSAESLDLFLSNADEWLSSLLNPGAAAFSAPTQPLDFGFSLF
ncbi:hypothetical protein PHSY_002896 [Pseudozyma hubeiensis SY62]|uniref:Zn(2)-C6 fungal-type domain-containing protein n=1 Tax=Pseudozyma hubeiensis (strain SY62) TaxID=1305764 RepID=R9P229_PSEHS|nr:hypothetical protein PHSY_002896 [Pseudozyma hubeiensis SY62]GAC95321.1 hypothetical protein PHSY_002896 [Pseudozyma hubeiensis SY62]